MTSTRLVQLLAVIFFATCLSLVSVFVVPKLDKERNTIMPPLDIKKVATLDPSATLANALLTVFRGLAVDYYWYQANKLKEEGRYFDANAKAEAITSLQPRFPKVWSFHAWNMSYNISVATYTPEERWDWVNKGINLLRERGIPYNPKSVVLYKELGWIFGHKVGAYSDDMHWFYKRNLAQEWQEVLPPNDGLKKVEALAQFKPIVDAPETLDDLIKKSPEVAPLLQAFSLFKKPLKADEFLLRRISRLMMFNNTRSAAMLGFKMEQFPGTFDEVDHELIRVISGEKQEPAVRALLSHLRRRILIDRYHMSPEHMYHFMELFGPLDFRHPAAHNVYWSTLGTKTLESGIPPGDTDILNTYRGSIHGLQALMHQGRVNYDPVTKKLDYLPDPRFIAAYEKALDMTQVATSQPTVSSGAKSSFDSGYENFLLIAIVYSYLYGDEKEAAMYYDKVIRLFGKKDDNVRSGKYTVPLEDLVAREMTDTIDILAHARQAIDGFLFQAISQGLRNDRREVYDKFVKLALYVHTEHNKKAGATPLADQKRMGLLPFNKIVAESMLGYLRDAADPIERARVWNAARNMTELAEARYEIYDTLQERAIGEAKALGLNPDRAFPEPPDMDKWRLANKPKEPLKTDIKTSTSGVNTAGGRLNADAAGTENRPPARDGEVRVENK